MVPSYKIGNLAPSIKMNQQIIKIAILNLYEGTENQGMRCLREIIHDFSTTNNITLQLEEFDVRLLKETPGTEFDLYISTGGPGNPMHSENSDWENIYFEWLTSMIHFNENEKNHIKKNIFFICHSFQLACRYFNVAQVIKRKSTSFGVFPVHFIEENINDVIFSGLSNPFYAVDNRDYQVVQPNEINMKKVGAKILAIEKDRPHVQYERAIMAMRFNKNMIGTQFHPEADSIGMTKYLSAGEKKTLVIQNYGEEKWKSMIDQLNDPEKISLTHDSILPAFLQLSILNHSDES